MIWDEKSENLTDTKHYLRSLRVAKMIMPAKSGNQGKVYLHSNKKVDVLVQVTINFLILKICFFCLSNSRFESFFGFVFFRADSGEG